MFYSNHYPKRTLASLSGCKVDLQEELQLLFKAFTKALVAYEKEISQTPTDCRVISLEASLLNSKMIQSVREVFPNNCRFGKYRRFILHVNNYSILFKKLNSKDMPMNIKTKHVNDIANQISLPLFEASGGAIDPILFFGYKKDRIIGKIHDPKLVYIDENKVQWTITERDLQTIQREIFITPGQVAKAKPTLKVVAKKKASGDS